MPAAARPPARPLTRPGRTSRSGAGSGSSPSRRRRTGRGAGSVRGVVALRALSPAAHADLTVAAHHRHMDKTSIALAALTAAALLASGAPALASHGGGNAGVTQHGSCSDGARLEAQGQGRRRTPRGRGRGRQQHGRPDLGLEDQGQRRRRRQGVRHHRRPERLVQRRAPDHRPGRDRQGRVPGQARRRDLHGHDLALTPMSRSLGGRPGRSRGSRTRWVARPTGSASLRG